jgi:hypothetical protein
MPSWLHKLLSGLLVLEVAVLATVLALLLPLVWFAEPPPYGQDPFHSVIAGSMVLLIWVVLVIVVLLSQESGPDSDPKGELERLIQLKHTGRLLQRPWRVPQGSGIASPPENQTVMTVPAELVPEIQDLIARRSGT